MTSRVPDELLPPAPVPASSWSAPDGEVVAPLAGCTRVLAISAHPDDETVGAGRLLADCSGVVDAVTLTAGERCVAHHAFPASELSTRRLNEWRAALPELGARPVESARWPDGGLSEVPDRIEDLLAELAVSYDALVVTWEHDPHPDHAAAGRAAARVGARLGLPVHHVPVWAPYWMTPDQVARTGATLRRVPTSPAAGDARVRALAHYRSQLLPLAPGWPPVVPSEVLDRHPHQWLAVES